MKKLNPSSTIYVVWLSIVMMLLSCNNEGGSINKNSTQDKIAVEVGVQSKLLRHVVLFKFNDKATPVIVNQIEEKFAALSNEITEIHSIEWGINNSPEGLDKGLSHCFLVTFLSEEDRGAYLPHPKHKEFVKFIGPYVEDVTVVDYWTE